MTELEKMRMVHQESQMIGAFLEWLEEKGIQLAVWNEDADELFLYRYTINDLLAQHFGIDLDQVDREQKAILEELRRHA